MRSDKLAASRPLTMISETDAIGPSAKATRAKINCLRPSADGAV